jgi:hypothetical protein
MTPGEDGQSGTIELGDGREISVTFGELTLPGDRRVSLPAPGVMSEGAGADEGCGDVLTVKVLASGDDRAWLLVAPGSKSLGGDMCQGKPAAELAKLIRLTP